jgi:hypothetical protein
MTGVRFSGLILAAAIVAFGGYELPAQSTPSGLPPLIESLGADDPPDLPGAAPSVDTVSPPFLQKPAGDASASRSGSVLDTLDNLPPVGTAEPRATSPASLPPDLPSPPDDGSRAQPDESPRVVRFGDVRSETTARQQFPELRSRAANGGRSSQVASARPTEPDDRPVGFLSRLMPWRRQPPPEPPLMTRRSPEEGLYRSDRSSETGSVARPALADRIDQELQKKAERTARQIVGSKTTELDVQVVNEEIYIRARPMWFWQRRQLTEELRNLPGLEAKRLHVTVY